ncbi:MAG: hypothetical protein Q8P67_04185, partial [archaeon]|nr:hypothetical protein [archaeon]
MSQQKVSGSSQSPLALMGSEPAPSPPGPPGGSVPAAASAPARSQLWELTEAKGFFTNSRAVNVISGAGTYLRADEDSSVVDLVTHARGWEEWTIKLLPGGTVALKSKHGTYLQALTNGEILQSRKCKSPPESARWVKASHPQGRWSFFSPALGTFLKMDTPASVSALPISSSGLRASTSDLLALRSFSSSSSLVPDLPISSSSSSSTSTTFISSESASKLPSTPSASAPKLKAAPSTPQVSPFSSSADATSAPSLPGIPHLTSYSPSPSPPSPSPEQQQQQQRQHTSASPLKPVPAPAMAAVVAEDRAPIFTQEQWTLGQCQGMMANRKAVNLVSFDGTFLRADEESNGIDLVTYARGWEEWKVERRVDDIVALKSKHGTYLQVLDSGNVVQSPKAAQAPESGLWTMINC